MWDRMIKLIVLFSVVGLVSGCIGSRAATPIRYYLIDPVEFSSTSSKGMKQLSLEIVDLHIPQYLERFHIATRSSKSRLEFSENNQWGENLRKNLLRTMARNLSKLLSTIDIGTPLNRSSSLPDYRVQIHIEQFEQEIDNKVKLIARWQLSGRSQSKPLGVFSAELQGEKIIEVRNYDQMVSEMRLLYGELSELIAETIIAQEK